MALTAENEKTKGRAPSPKRKRRKKRRRSQAPVALIYFMTLLIFLGVFGVFAGMIVNRLSNHLPEDADLSGNYIDSYNTLYARVNSGNVLSDLFVIRICPEQDRILVVPMSAFTVSNADGGMTFREVYEEGGIRNLQTAVDSTFGISTDFYVTLSNESFEDICDIIGGITYAPEEELYYIDKNGDNDISLREGKAVALAGKQIRLILQMPVFSIGRQGNMDFLGFALTEIINNAFEQVEMTTNSLDIIYSKISSNSATSLSENDYKEHRVYIKEMLSKQITPAEALIPEGTWTDETHFVPSGDFKQMLYDTMEATKSQSKSGNSIAEE